MSPRRVARIAFAAALAGCSYDWTIGSGSVSDLPPIFDVDAEPPPHADAAAETGAPEAGRPDAGDPQTKTGECGRRCRCEGTERCRYTCTTSPCRLDCEDRSNCALTCAQGAECEVACRDDATCDMDCTAGGSSCNLICRNDATCAGQCRNGSVCTRQCPQRCDIECRGGGICPP